MNTPSRSPWLPFLLAASVPLALTMGRADAASAPPESTASSPTPSPIPGPDSASNTLAPPSFGPGEPPPSGASDLPMMDLPKTEAGPVFPIPIGAGEPDFKISNTRVMPGPALAAIGPVSVLDGFDALLGAPPLPNGFTYHGAEIGLMGGSYGRTQGLVQAGGLMGDFALFGAYSDVKDDGWQQHAGARMRQAHGDLGWRNGGNEYHVILHSVSSMNKGALLSPVELIAADQTAQLNYPSSFGTDSTHIKFTGSYALNDGWTAESKLSFGKFKSKQVITLGGALVNDCPSNPALLCSGTTPYMDIHGNQFSSPGADYYAYKQTLTSETTAWGAAASASNRGQLMGRLNNFTMGVDYNRARARASYRQNIGTMTEDGGYGTDLGVTDSPPVGRPEDASAIANYVGLYATDSIDVTDKLKVAFGGRFSYSNVESRDLRGTRPSFNENRTFTHFAPSLGATYALTPGLIAYGGYSETARVLAPSGTFCEDRESACNSVPPWFVSDTITDQSVYRTYKIGLRGQLPNLGLPIAGAQLAWNAALYRTDISDYTYVAASTGRPSLANVGTVRRQGVKLGAEMVVGAVTTSVGYIYTDARFQSSFSLFQPLNTSADANGYIHVKPGNVLPNEPKHQLVVSMKTNVTPKWVVGTSLRAVSSSYYFGDEINAMGKVPGYVVASFNFQYRIDNHWDVFGIVENAFNTRYAVTGGLASTSQHISLAPGATDSRAQGIGQPRSIYVGFRYKF
ncbi:TonB-dependent receptor [Variovorax ginsengisoli]|uniref:Iron complex outermembrane receptor protein n=1 Tax=Variovorax ginsengisoli TaxID=363844 RepID=A0ABT9S3E7_9BURK|nr:TonB-dependent receptor [Variovorax ginsengisoli]MDP9898413.1 iron complex outermembrane receptor protein [Variovorax ginsengisoli]